MSLVLRVLIPIAYTLFVAGAFGIIFDKKIERAIAPAFFVQIMLMLISAMAFGTLTSGAIIGIVVSLVGVCYKCLKERSAVSIKNQFYVSSSNSGVVLIILIYIITYIINYGSVFNAWDEFSHWGIFVKEMYRLDALYCTSPATMAHKDYVPAISIFETLWCRLSLRYSESDAYRGIQMLQASMLLPLLTMKSENSDNKIENNGSTKQFLNDILGYAIKIVLAFGIPIFFGNFYHTIYQDLIYGVIVYYCMFIIIVEKDDIYKTGILTLSITILILSKMTAMAFLPMLIIFWFVWNLKFEYKKYTRRSLFAGSVVLVAIPICIWKIFNNYVDRFVNTGTGEQSFSGISFQDVIDVVAHNGNIPFQLDVEKNYLKALFVNGVFAKISFVSLVIASVLLVLYIARLQDDNLISKAKISLINLWIVLASLAYIILMWYLYLTAFSEYEAVSLASYSRYMGTMGVIIVLMVLLVVLRFENEKVNRVKICLAVVVLENLLLFVDTKQLVPGIILGEQIQYESEARAIMSHSDENASVLFVARGSSGEECIRIQYLCAPRNFRGISPGEARHDGDIWSSDISVEQFVDEISKYDLLYLFDIDDAFCEKYNDAFANPEIIENHRLYVPTYQNGKIFLKDVEDI